MSFQTPTHDRFETLSQREGGTKMSKGILIGIISVIAVLVLTVSARAPQETATGNRKVTPQQFEQWKKDLNNWGRWGKDDEIGTMNFITPAKRKQAAALVKDGFSVSLAADVDTQKAIDNPQPYEHEMLGLGTDRIGVAFHGIAHTHLDSLAHINMTVCSITATSRTRTR